VAFEKALWWKETRFSRSSFYIGDVWKLFQFAVRSKKRRSIRCQNRFFLFFFRKNLTANFLPILLSTANWNFSFFLGIWAFDSSKILVSKHVFHRNFFGKNISRTDYVVFVPMESLATTTKNLNKKERFSSRLAKVMRKLRDMWKWKSEQTSSNTHAIALISILRTSSMISTRVRSRSHHHAHPLKVTKKRMSLPWTLQKDVVTH